MPSAVAFRRDIRAAIDANLSPRARSSHLAALARAELHDLLVARRVGESFRVFVDGRLGASEDTVRGDGGGVILYEFSYSGEAAAFALAYLRTRSPVLSGGYRDSFFVAVNGRSMPAREFVPARTPPEAEIIIGNSQPYNRKVDVQIVGTTRLRYRVPPNLFADAARAVMRRYGNSVTATRVSDINFAGKYRLVRKRRRGRAVESPAIVIAPR